MNNLFGGQKTQNLDGGISQTNPFKDTVERITNVDERFENMQRAKTLSDMQMERSFQNMKIEEGQIDHHMHAMNSMNMNFGMMNPNLININSEKFMHQNEMIKDRNFQGTYLNTGMMQNMPMQMMPQIHPMLFQFNQQIQNQPILDNQVLTEENPDKQRENDILTDIIKTMEGQEDERHLNSEFLKFIKRMKTGEIKLNEKENNIIQENRETLEFNQPNQQDVNDNMEEMWNNIENQMKGINFEEADYPMELKKEALLLHDNPFLDINKQNDIKDFNEYARQALDKGEYLNARFALEAEVTKNADNAEAWLHLGKMHTENDRDDLAMECFLKAIDADPFNADALLALGISCTNEFDEFEAMVHLRNWIKLHHIYNKYFDNENFLLNYEMIRAEMINDRDDEDYYSKAVRIEGLKQNFYREMVSLMEAIAANEKVQDTDLWIALGIAHFIPHQNERAIECFRKAVEANPQDHNAWNKLGAILAHSKMNEEAIATYKKALQLKPNYARCWANLGIAYFNKDNYDESMRSFLTALRIYKDIGPVWSYMSSVTTAQKRQDLYELVQNRNLDALLKHYGM